MMPAFISSFTLRGMILAGTHGQIAQHLADYLQKSDPSWKVAFFGWPEMGYLSVPSISYLAPKTTGIDF